MYTTFITLSSPLYNFFQILPESNRHLLKSDAPDKKKPNSALSPALVRHSATFNLYYSTR